MLHPDAQAWAAAGGDPRKLDLYGALGAIAPFADGDARCLAAIHPALPEVGAIGDWVGSDTVRLATEAWLAAHGCKVARGPMELCTWFPYRANLGPFDEPPFAMEPTERVGRWVTAGYAPVAHYASAVADHDAQITAARDRAASLSSSGWRLESLPAGPDGKVPEAEWPAAVRLVHQMSSAAFADAFGFVPIPEAALQAVYAPYRTLVDPELTLLVRDPDGAVAGFLFALPDLAAPDRGWFLVKTLAVLPEHRQRGVGSWLVAASHRVARRKGYKAGVHCLMWTGSRSNDISQHGGRVFRRYALLEKPLG